jgi:hypothetical protein
MSSLYSNHVNIAVDGSAKGNGWLSVAGRAT